MSRSEHLQDASMDEILASIRKIITDDGPEGPDADALAHAALDDFRDAGAALAPPAQTRNYMGDLTRALASATAPVAADDDIFDEAAPAPGYAKRVGDALAEAIRAPQATLPSMPSAAVTMPDDDTDLFEPEAEPLEVDVAIEAVAPLEADADEDVVAELEDPIALGPDIELVDEPIAVVEAVAVASSIVAVDPGSTSSDVSVTAAVETSQVVAAAPPPPPPPPPVIAGSSAENEEPEVVEAVAPVEPALAEPAAALAAEVETAEAPVPVAEAALAVEAASATETPIADQAATDSAEEMVAPSLEAAAAALIEEIAAPVSEPDAGAVEPMTEIAEASSDLATPEIDQPAAHPSRPAAPPLVPDDMMAAMLKPMLKEWLDANMPRIVAKAMSGKDEMAAQDS